MESDAVPSDQLVAYALLLSQAVFDVVSGKGILTQQEIDEHIMKLRAELRINLQPPS